MELLQAIQLSKNSGKDDWLPESVVTICEYFKASGIVLQSCWGFYFFSIS